MTEDKKILCPNCHGGEFELYQNGIVCTLCGEYTANKKPTKRGHILKLEAEIYYNNLIWRHRNVKKIIAEFLQNNDGNSIDVTFEAHNHVEHWQFRYLFGFLYVQLAEGMGEAVAIQYGEVDFNDPGILEIDAEMKRQFLTFEIKKYSDIPSRHKKKCEIFMTKDTDKTGKEILNYHSYRPSKSVLSFQEMKKYILQCEFTRDQIGGWAIKNEAIVREMYKIRSLALKEK